MAVKNTRQKGRKFILNCLEHLRNDVDINAYEVVGSGQGKDKGDIRVPSCDLVIEGKGWETISMKQWVEQSEKEGLGQSKTALFWKMPGSPQANPEIRVDISYQYFVELLQRNKEPKLKDLDRSFRWKLERLKDAINQVKRDLP